MDLSCLIMCCLSRFLEANLVFFSPSLFLHPGLYPVSAQVEINLYGMSKWKHPLVCAKANTAGTAVSERLSGECPVEPSAAGSDA